MEATPFVSVIIPTYHDWYRLKLCLGALENQSYPSSRFEVLVVNNDPDDQPPFELSSGKVRLLEEAKPGSYAARNTAIQVAKGAIFAFTDSDCIPDQDWLKYAVEALSMGYDRIAGHVEIFCINKPPTLPEVYELIFAFNQRRNAENGVSVTANFICFRYCFEQIGFFNDNLLSGGDIEWGRRASNEELSIWFEKKVVVWHPARGSITDLSKKVRRVAGGLQVSGNFNRLESTFLFGLLPPIRAFKVILSSPHISIGQKVALGFLSYYLKLLMTFTRFRLMLGLLKPVR